MAGRIALVGIVAVNLTASSTAWSGDPDPIQSTIPSVITLVGESAGVPDPRGTFQITLKDANQDHIPYTNVYVNLSSCGDPIPAQDQAGMLYGCNGVFTAKTNLAGIATFTIVGSTLHRQYMGAIPNCAVI